MSGSKGGVQIQMRYHSPSALYVYCRCHQLQLAAVYAANKHNEVKKVFGTLACGKLSTTRQKKLRS